MLGQSTDSIQMPIVDGMSSCKMIRSGEKVCAGKSMTARAAQNGRVPIFAVSASLVERDRQIYIDAGFDGWVLKPVSFTRLNELMKGIVDKELRDNNVYKSGSWEQGGWFTASQPDMYQADTRPSDRIPFSEPSDAARNAVATGPEASPHMQQQQDVGMEKSR